MVNGILGFRDTLFALVLLYVTILVAQLPHDVILVTMIMKQQGSTVLDN